MTRITVDQTLQQKLQGHIQPVELCDPSGHVLGKFLPRFDPALYENLEPQISEEELRRRSESKERTYTTEEVIAHLESLK